MNPMAAYQVAHAKELAKKKILSDPKRRQRYFMQQERKRRLEELELKNRYDYWLNR